MLYDETKQFYNNKERKGIETKIYCGYTQKLQDEMTENESRKLLEYKGLEDIKLEPSASKEAKRQSS